MLLAIDIGNSHTVIGLLTDNRWHRQWRLGTDRRTTVDELASRLKVLFEMEKVTFDQVSGVVIACVVPPLAATWQEFSRRWLGLKPDNQPLIISNRLDCGIKVACDNPAEVGADRLVNAAAAWRRHQSALIVVDFGTAITLDCVSAAGEYLGGTISPGVAISLDALHGRTAKLPRVDIATPPTRAIGGNTEEAIRSGILYGYAGLITGLLQRLGAEMAPAQPRIVATGGLAGVLAPYIPQIDEVDPQLTLEGLRLLYELNR